MINPPADYKLKIMWDKPAQGNHEAFAELERVITAIEPAIEQALGEGQYVIDWEIWPSNQDHEHVIRKTQLRGDTK